MIINADIHHIASLPKVQEKTEFVLVHNRFFIIGIAQVRLNAIIMKKNDLRRKQMKRIISILLMIFMCLSVVSCSSNRDDEEFQGDYNDSGISNDSRISNDSGISNDNNSTLDNDVKYLSDRDIDYYEEDNQYILFFGLKNAAEQRISASGKAGVIITNSDGVEIYNKTLTFNSDDFSNWTNALLGERYLCGLRIKADNFKHNNSSTGKVALTITLDDGTYFDESTMTIYDLPEHDWDYATCTKSKTCKGCGATSGSAKEHNYYSDGKCGSCGALNPEIENGLSKCNLVLPSLPYTLNEYDYNDEIEYSFKVTDISYKFEVNNDGYISLFLYFSANKSYDVDGAGQSDSCTISYKIYDSDDNVITSNSFYSPALAMGEKFSDKEERAIDTYDKIKPGTYRLELLSTNHR